MDAKTIESLLMDTLREEFGRFDRIEEPWTQRKDLYAFRLLAELSPGQREIVAAADRDAIYLSVTVAELAFAEPTMEQLAELARCRVMCDRERGCLMMRL